MWWLLWSKWGSICILSFPGNVGGEYHGRWIPCAFQMYFFVKNPWICSLFLSLLLPLPSSSSSLVKLTTWKVKLSVGLCSSATKNVPNGFGTRLVSIIKIAELGLNWKRWFSCIFLEKLEFFVCSSARVFCPNFKGGEAKGKLAVSLI